jgi:hypothetical protein
MGTREPLAAATSCVGVSEGLSELARIPECGDGRGNPFAVNPPELAVDKPCYCIFIDCMEITRIQCGSQMMPPRISLL